MNAQVLLSVVIVNWNCKELLRKCLESLRGAVASINHEVIVVDNASDDGSSAMVRHEYPQFFLLQNNENVGFARANNQAMPRCVGKYIMLLNPDTVVSEGALETLIGFMETHPEAGAVGPKTVHPAGRLRVLSGGYRLGLRTVFNHYFFLSRLFPNRPTFRGVHLLAGIHDRVPMEVEWLSGVALMVRRAVIDEVGLLDERWFMYAEDLEWCDRITDAGWVLYHVPEAEVVHYFGASSRRNVRTSTMWVRSMHSYFTARHDSCRARLVLFDLIVIVGLLLRALIYLLRALVGSQRMMWAAEARRFLLFSRECMRLLARDLSGAR